MSPPRPVSILVINPNSSESMTRALEPVLADLLHPALTVHYHTGPKESPASINDITTSVASATHTLDSLLSAGIASLDQGNSHDAYLVACFSNHPLVEVLREHTAKPVLGIFEASIMQSLALGQPFGVVTTGKYWEKALTDGVRRCFGSADLGGMFVGVESTSLTALELHETNQAIVKEALGIAASRIVARGAHSIIMGCAGMSGMEEAILVGCKGVADVIVVDAVRSGVTLLEGLVRAHGRKSR